MVIKGVGGWARKGVDPAMYARALMEGASSFVASHPTIADPLLMMKAGYDVI